MFAFVVYYRQGRTPEEVATVRDWSLEMIDAATALGGAYYPPYQVFESPEQFHAAFPRDQEYFALKARVDPDNRLVASGGSDRSVILTDIEHRQTAVLRGHRTIVTAAVFSPDGRCLATGDDDGTIKLWHTATRQYLYDLAVDRGACSKLLFSADGRRLAALVEGRVHVFDTQCASNATRDE